MLACLPILFDGSRGKYGWIPVKLDDRRYVVVSLSLASKMIDQIITANGGTTSIADIKNALRVCLKMHSLFDNKAEYRAQARLFIGLMLLTPYKVWCSCRVSIHIDVNVFFPFFKNSKY